jgi:membrane protein DedA with SNARE-associated domain
VLIVFGVVLVEQIGLPIPAFPILIVAGAFAVDGGISWPAALAVSLLACLISDYFWFRAGRYFGKRILRLLCQISLSPDYCVSQTEDNFSRWGPKALVVAKFIPGFNTIAPPLAGALGTSNATFLGFSVAGALLWSGSRIALGAAFAPRSIRCWTSSTPWARPALMVLGGLLLLFIVYKYVERRRFRQAVDIERLTVEELKRLLAQGTPAVLVDART